MKKLEFRAVMVVELGCPPNFKILKGEWRESRSKANRDFQDLLDMAWKPGSGMRSGTRPEQFIEVA